MIIRYQMGGEAHEFVLSDSDDLTRLCEQVEARLRAAHPALAEAHFLAERVADALLNSLASEQAEADLGALP